MKCSSSGRLMATMITRSSPVLSRGYYPIQWSIDSLDWKDYGVDDIISVSADSKHLDGGAIILCHNGAKYTADALDNLLTQLQEKRVSACPYLRAHLPGKISSGCDRKTDC